MDQASTPGVIESRSVGLGHFRAGEIAQLPLANVALDVVEAPDIRIWKEILVTPLRETLFARVRVSGRRLSDKVSVLVQDPRMLFHRRSDCAACDRDRAALTMQDTAELHNRLTHGEILAAIAAEVRIWPVEIAGKVVLVHTAFYDPDTFDTAVSR